ncbi:MAG: Dyp-type peroxidase [Pseudomonadota bacterium]
MKKLNLSNIQGNILRGYRSFTRARFLYFSVRKAEAGRAFIGRLLDEELITAAQWKEKPDCAVNVAVSAGGLLAMNVPAESVYTFPPAFCEGMKVRATGLGDTGESSPANWDRPWRSDHVHVVVMCYAETERSVNEHARKVRGMLPDGIRELSPAQKAHQIIKDRLALEHFGFADGIGNPVVEGMPSSNERRGGANLVAPGEFVLGYPGIGGEEPHAPQPRALVHDGSFLVLRKLSQNVQMFRHYLHEQEAVLKRVDQRYGAGFLAAKMVGRWPNGTSLIKNPDASGDGIPDNQFDYRLDPQGSACPLGAHIRRSNPRAALGLGGLLSQRRLVMRRGIAYGKFVDEHEVPDDEDRGIMFLAYMTNIERQFEFLQRQWINHGDDLDQGNDKDAIIGDNNGTGRMVVPGDERTGRAPVLLTRLPRFVGVRGGEYLFAPSLSALGLLAENLVELSF